MRYLIFFLLAGNLIFWVWYIAPWSGSPPTQQTRDVLTSRVETLVLIDEQPLPQNAPLPDVDHGLPKVMEQEPVDSADTMDAAGTKMPPVEELPTEEQPVAGKAILPHCHSLGPFRDRQSADKMQVQLKRKGLKITFRTSDIKEQIGYWVFLQAGSKQEAQDVVTVLKQEGISDYFVGRNNSISLGAFSRQRVADAHRVRIAKLGFSPYLEPRYRTRPAYWLDLVETGPDFLEKEFWEDLTASASEEIYQQAECQ